MKKRIIAIIAILASQAANAEEVNVNARIAKLEQELALLKRQLEVQEEKDVAAAEKSAIVELGKKGLKISSPDKKHELALGGFYQFDSRNFLDGQEGRNTEQFLSRRVRTILTGKSGNASFRFMPEFGSGTGRVFDAHIDYKLSDSLQFRYGKFKAPVSLERLQSAAEMFNIERSHPNSLAPNRDIGFMVYGEPILGELEYQIGIFNGNEDLGNTDSDVDDNKDLIARVFAHPFRNSDNANLQGLGIGIAGTIGERDGSTTNRITPVYKSIAQQDIFAYRNDAFADGLQWRLYPQGYWYLGNKGLMAEYAISDQEITRGANHDSLQHSAWQLSGSYVLTGEDVNFLGGLRPYEDFSLQGNGLGAWEVTARLSGLDIDDDAFTNYADAATSISSAQTYGTGLNWYLSENLKLMVNYDYTEYEGGAAGGADKEAEQIVLTRAQLRF